jgi:hypothetical protein
MVPPWFKAARAFWSGRLVALERIGRRPTDLIRPIKRLTQLGVVKG